MKNQMIQIVVLMGKLTKNIKKAKSIIVVVALCLNHLVVGASDSVEITGLKDLYQYGDTIKIKIENGTQNSIFCAGELEVMSGGDSLYLRINDIWSPYEYRKVKLARKITPTETVERKIYVLFLPQGDNVVYCRLKVHYKEENASDNDKEMSYVRTFKIKGVKFFQP